MGEFLYICEYLDVTPMEFFNEDREYSPLQKRAMDYIYTLSDDDLQLMIGLIERIKRNR